MKSNLVIIFFIQLSAVQTQMCYIYPTKIKFSQCCHVYNWEAKHKKYQTSFLYKIQILKPN